MLAYAGIERGTTFCRAARGTAASNRAATVRERFPLSSPSDMVGPAHAIQNSAAFVRNK